MRMPLIAFLVIRCLSILLPTPGVAQTSPVRLSDSELHEFHTEDGSRFAVFVALPNTYEESEDREYPVLYMTDPPGQFQLVAQTARLLMLGREIPTILVGIGRWDTSTPYAITRFRDLTPTGPPEDVVGTVERYGQEVSTGGADLLLSVLVDEIVPWIDTRYRASDTRGLAGYSLGGLFATHVLLSAPTSFTHYLIGSPSLWWNDGVMFEREEAYARENSDLPARVFLSAGTDEYFGGPDEFMMLPNMLRFAETLAGRNYPGLELGHHILVSETHLSGIPATFSRGLRFLFGGM